MPDTLNTAMLQHVKVAQTEYPVNDLLRARWSARSFSDEAISTNAINTIFEAAHWAPSSMNEQPWAYVYARKGTPMFQAMADVLMAGNHSWAKNANVLIASVARTTHASNGAFNKYALYDTGSANQNLLLQAASMGILGHVMGGFHKAQAEELLALPDGYELVCFIALGYLAPAEGLEEPFLTRETTPRQRKPMDTFVFQDSIK